MRIILMLTMMATMTVPSLSFGQATGNGSGKGKAWDDLEKELWKVDQVWLESSRNKKLDVLQDLWTPQFFEINSGGTVPNKAEQLERLRQRVVKPDTGAFPDDFKLRAVYGNFALATDHTNLKGTFYKGHDFSGEYRVLRMFVKENGKWRVAGAALCPIITP